MGQQSRANLYGNVPDRSPVVLLLIDVINDLSFPDRAGILRQITSMAPRLADLKSVAKSHGCAVVYVNDNFGRWRSDFRSQVEHCLHDHVPGRALVEQLQPQDDDYFVLKPAHSGFFSTTLELLLKHLHAETLIVTGIATDICVFFTASDAFLRGYSLHVPSDCVAANSIKQSRDALRQMAQVLKADTSPSTSLPWRKWRTRFTALS